MHTPPTLFPSRVFLFRFEASIPFPRLNRLFVSVSIDTPVSFPSIRAPAFLLSFPRSLHISPLLPEASFLLLVRLAFLRVILSLSVCSPLTSVSPFLSLRSRRRVLCPVHQQLRVSVRIGEALALPPLSFFCSLRLVLLLLLVRVLFPFRFSGFSVPVPRPTTFVFSVTAWRTPALAAPSSDVR